MGSSAVKSILFGTKADGMTERILSNNGSLIPTSSANAIALGLVPGASLWIALGEKDTIGTEVTGEDLWRGNELTTAGSGSLPSSIFSIPTPADAGELMTIVSENNADNGATVTGILTVTIDYLDATGDEQETTVTLNGTTPVNIPTLLMRFINDMHTATVGSNGVAEGHIKIYKTGSPGLVYNMIYEGGNKSIVPNRMVPNGKVLVLKDWHAAETKDKEVIVRMRGTSTPEGTLLPGVFLFKSTTMLSKTTSGILPLGEAIPALAIVKPTAWGIQTAAKVTANWRGELYDE